MTGVAGHRAFLPCDLTPPSQGEVVIIIIIDIVIIIIINIITIIIIINNINARWCTLFFGIVVMRGSLYTGIEYERKCGNHLDL